MYLLETMVCRWIFVAGSARDKDLPLNICRWVIYNRKIIYNYQQPVRYILLGFSKETCYCVNTKHLLGANKMYLLETMVCRWIFVAGSARDKDLPLNICRWVIYNRKIIYNYQQPVRYILLGFSKETCYCVNTKHQHSGAATRIHDDR